MPRPPNSRPLKDFHVVNRDSGQVYTETESTPAIAFSNGPAWVHESPYLPIGWEEGSPFEASPLRHVAMRKLLSDQRNLSPSLFANLPWNLASDMWEMLGRCKKQTLHMWKILAAVYPAQLAEIEKHRSMMIEGPKLSMREYLGLTKSNNLSWRVVLMLATSYARVPEIVGISEIKNLCALDIATPAHQEALPEDTDMQVTALTDRIVRAWSELAQTAGAFQHLQVLVLRHQRELSKVALNYFRSFPNLQTVITYDCPGIEDAVHSGHVDGWTITEGKRTAPVTVYRFYDAICRASESDLSIPYDTPVLEFQVGQMKKARGPMSAPYSAIYLDRTGPTAGTAVNTGPTSKKRKPTGSISQTGNAARKAKPVMKDRTKDIGDVLSSFF